MKKEEENDFGFSFADEDDTVVPVQKAMQLQDKVQGLRAMIMPLLENLKKNPEKDYIKWPNRVKKIDEFIKKMDDYIEK